MKPWRCFSNAPLQSCPGPESNGMTWIRGVGVDGFFSKLGVDVHFGFAYSWCGCRGIFLKLGVSVHFGVAYFVGQTMGPPNCTCPR